MKPFPFVSWWGGKVSVIMTMVVGIVGQKGVDDAGNSSDQLALSADSEFEG